MAIDMMKGRIGCSPRNRVLRTQYLLFSGFEVARFEPIQVNIHVFLLFCFLKFIHVEVRRPG